MNENRKGKGDWMQTYLGKEFFPRDPNPEDIEIVDIATALSNLCRFCGHTKFFYSVAQHSVLASYLVDEDIALEALMHDSAEAYTGDLIRPIKKSVSDWVELEKTIVAAICEKFKLRHDVIEGRDVKHADDTMLATEKRDIMGPAPAEWMPLPNPSEKIITYMSPADAKQMFLDRFDELSKRRK